MQATLVANNEVPVPLINKVADGIAVALRFQLKRSVFFWKVNMIFKILLQILGFILIEHLEWPQISVELCVHQENLKKPRRGGGWKNPSYYSETAWVGGEQIRVITRKLLGVGGEQIRVITRKLLGVGGGQ